MSIQSLRRYKTKSDSVLHQLTKQFQLKLIKDSLNLREGNISKASEYLGISRATFYKLLKVLKQ